MRNFWTKMRLSTIISILNDKRRRIFTLPTAKINMKNIREKQKKIITKLASFADLLRDTYFLH